MLKEILFIILASIGLVSQLISDEIDLEERVQDFVLETKQITIPGYPYAFNPSIVRWQGRLLMSFREIPPRASTRDNLLFDSGGPSRIALVWLGEDWTPISIPQVLTLALEKRKHPAPCRSEDARLIAVGEKLYIVYSDNKNKIVTERGYRMYTAEVTFDGVGFSVSNTDRLVRFEGENQNRREKNWVPFDYHGHLLLAYSLAPHRIFIPIAGTTRCETIATTLGNFDWNLGELRGGTPALPIDDKHYLAFFHTVQEMATSHSEGKVMPHYFMGAYTFSLEHPFAITQISPEPIVGQNFYKGPTYKPYWKPVRVVFPCGFIFDDDFIWISYGRQDHEIWMVKLDKQGLLNSLVPVVPTD